MNNQSIKTTQEFLAEIKDTKKFILLDFDGVLITTRCVLWQRRNGDILMDEPDPLAMTFVHRWALKHEISIIPFTTHAGQGFDHCAKILLNGIESPQERFKMVALVKRPINPATFGTDDTFKNSQVLKNWSATAFEENRRTVVAEYLMSLIEPDQRMAWIDDYSSDFYMSDSPALGPNGINIPTNPDVGIMVHTHNALMEKLGIGDNIVALL